MGSITSLMGRGGRSSCSRRASTRAELAAARGGCRGRTRRRRWRSRRRRARARGSSSCRRPRRSCPCAARARTRSRSARRRRRPIRAWRPRRAWPGARRPTHRRRRRPAAARGRPGCAEQLDAAAEQWVDTDVAGIEHRHPAQPHPEELSDPLAAAAGMAGSTGAAGAAGGGPCARQVKTIAGWKLASVIPSNPGPNRPPRSVEAEDQRRGELDGLKDVRAERHKVRAEEELEPLAVGRELSVCQPVNDQRRVLCPGLSPEVDDVSSPIILRS